MASTACANKTVMVFGLMELLLALGIITCGVFNIVNKSRLYKIHHGLWGGGYMALTAFFAIYAGLKQVSKNTKSKLQYRNTKFSIDVIFRLEECTLLI